MKLPLIVLLLCSLAACKNDAPALVKSAESKKKSKDIIIPNVHYGIEGFYTGVFEATKFDHDREAHDNQITICIDSLDDKNIFGHSVVAGTDRAFSGTYETQGADYIVTAHEPGDQKYDGSFEFTVSRNEHKLKGRWMAKNQMIPVTERSYALEYHNYKYDPSTNLPEEILESPIYGTYNEKTEKQEALTDDVLKLNASKKLLKTNEVENLYAGDLEVIRNTIYARHGYSFKNLRMRTLFDNSVYWYMPLSTDVTGQLTEIEKKNIALIKRYESHAAHYYDVFGR